MNNRDYGDEQPEQQWTSLPWVQILRYARNKALLEEFFGSGWDVKPPEARIEGDILYLTRFIQMPMAVDRIELNFQLTDTEERIVFGHDEG